MIRFWMVALFCLLAVPALAEKRAAFLLGNATYDNAPPLMTPLRDVRLLAATLETLEFEVFLYEELNHNAMTAAFSDFLRENTDADLMLFYYAGHGLRFEGQDFLLGTDVQLAGEPGLTVEALPVTQVVKRLERQSKAALVFIDAFRTNPLADRLQAQNLSSARALTDQDLAQITTAFYGSVMVFSSLPGQVAFDGGGENSPFAEALTKHLTTPGTEILSLMKRVIADVRRATGGQQSPIVTYDLIDEIYLRPWDFADSSQQIMPASQAVAVKPSKFEATLEIAARLNTPRGWTLLLRNFGPEVDVAIRKPASERPKALQEIDFAALGEAFEQGLEISVAEWAALQTRLTRMGFVSGGADGVFGPASRAALQAFQKTRGLTMTGMLDPFTMRALDPIAMLPRLADRQFVSAQHAVRYRNGDLSALGEMPELARIVDCVGTAALIYGVFDGHGYVVVANSGPLVLINRKAQSCGGHLAAIGSEAENSFLHDMFIHDDLFLRRGYDTATGYSYTSGPSFGLIWDKPTNRWQWMNGEPYRFSKWHVGQPKAERSFKRYALFMGDARGRTDMASQSIRTWFNNSGHANAAIMEFDLTQDAAR